jgi:hypothetical protein
MNCEPGNRVVTKYFISGYIVEVWHGVTFPFMSARVIAGLGGGVYIG